MHNFVNLVDSRNCRHNLLSGPTALGSEFGNNGNSYMNVDDEDIIQAIGLPGNEPDPYDR